MPYLDMVRRRSDQSWRAAALTAALLAITLNFLQPLAHASLMRGSGPASWTALCLSGSQQDDQSSTPAGSMHECCLGLAHAPTLAGPSSTSIAADLQVVVMRSLETAASLTPVGIRDGPGQPRAPPLLA